MGSTNPRTVSILGVDVDAVSLETVRNQLESALADDSVTFHIVTYNPEYAIAARRDPAFLAALRSGSLVTADGVGIVLTARLHRSAPPLERITGVEILGLLTQLSVSQGAGLYLLGAGPGVAERAAAELRRHTPGAQFSGWWWDGTPRPEDDAETLERISASGAKVLAVAYGAPAQIHWINRNRAALNAIGIRIVIGVGGALDYWAGDARRPPGIIQKLGLEWLFRLVREPWRWRRQLVLPLFAIIASIEGIRTWLPGSRRT